MTYTPTSHLTKEIGKYSQMCLTKSFTSNGLWYKEQMLG